MLRKFMLQKFVLLIVMLAGAVYSFSQNTSNKGREFWVGYGHHQFMETGTNAMNMRLYLSTEGQAATVTVTVDSSGSPFIPPPGIGSIWTRTYTIPPYTAIQSDIIPKGPVNVAAAPGDTPSDAFWDARLYDLPPESGGAGGSGIFRNKGIHIVSNVPITAYAHIYGSTSSGATMLIPITAWGYEYVSLNSNQNYASNCYSWTYVVAYKDNTVLQITPSVKTRGQNRTGLLPGVTSTVTLMKGQIYQLIGANLASDANGNGGTSSDGLNLSGTRIKSIADPVTGECYPIAVFAGSSRTSNPASCGSGGGDNDNQQLFPMHSWGKKYLTAPFSTSSNPAGAQTSIVKVAFSEPPPATQLKRNGAVVAVPAGSLFYTYESNTADLIEADKPIMVNQFMTGGTCMGGGGNVGDPEMVVVAPVEQAIKEVTFYRQSREAIGTNYLTLIVPTQGVPSLRIDNSAAFDYTYPHPRNAIMGKDYTVVVKRWNIGAGQGFQCNIRCDSAFNAITYGLGSVESYAYSAGAFINNLNAVTGIHNQPDITNPAQTLHQFTGVGTPTDLSILVKYQPTRLTWKFSEMNPLPGACMTANPTIAGDFIMNPASAFADGTVVINGVTYYKYKLPNTFTFNCTGTYEIPVESYSPGINNCGNREMFYPFVEVKAQPIVDFTYQNLTMCTKDTLYLTGPVSGLSGVTPFPMIRWEWFLPGGIIGRQKDTAIVLPPGTHEIKMVAITPEGLLSDTVRKTITIYPPPTTVLTAVPDVACIGQNITFTQTASYGNPAIPINNYYWNFGDGSSPLNNLNTSEVHSYSTANTYTAMGVVAVSNLCIADTAREIVTIAPQAQINFTYPGTCLPASGLAQFNAPATDLGGTPISSYTWNFGDPGSGANNTSSLQNPTHTYASYGAYTVTLDVVTTTGCSGQVQVPLNFGPRPALLYPAFAPVCPSATPISINTGTITNGVPATSEAYSGPGVTGTTFNPAVAGPGTHTLTYTVTTPTCTESITQTITVHAAPVVSAGTYGPVCINAAAIALAGTPAGGTFSGPGVTGTTFNPATAGAGTHTITYNYTDANGCPGTATTTITVNALPVVNAGTYAPVCTNAATVTLAGTPAGGTFSGPGVTGTTFNPATAGVGTHTITYSYTNASGCLGTGTATITVNALPVVNAGTYAPVCTNAAAITLAGTPAGGTFSGPGVTGTTFNPVTAGAGSHTITYNYTDANGCANSATTTITVNALPVVNAGTYAGTCIVGAPITLAGSPAGGTFSGPGVTGTTFNPATAGAGTHTITYSYTNANGCTATATTTILVYALPVVSAGTYTPACINGAAITLAGTPAGGTFSGPGVTGTSFNPVTAGIGTHTITYNYTDASGCSNSGTTTITVNALPVVNAGTYPAVCANAAAVTLAGTPAGGTFSGPGVTGTSFNPVTAGAGTHTITYNYTDANGCSNSTTTTITVNALPVVNAGTYAPVCINGAAVTLAGTPAGGTFSGPGVTGTSFNPATAGAGSHTITYNYTGANGCANSATTTITVNPLPVVNAGTYTPVCINGAAVTLAGTPAGGTFSGPGVTGNSFNPATAGAGTHTITYNYTDANGCANSTTTTITVNALPVVNAGTYPAVCVNAAAVTLAGTPAGGTFSGPGVTGNSFNPATAGAGTHTITYNYTDANGCANSTTTTITVNALPVVNAGTYAAVCINGAAVTLAGTPAGGTFSGPGVTGTSFNPATAGVGTHTITYNYTDANGCANSTTTTITVNALPVVNAGSYAPVCIDATPFALNGTPAGGTFSGPGVTGNTFNPATAGAGTHTITYNYTDANGCSNTNTATITVNPIPAINAGTYPPVCINATPVTLAGSPAGGTFSGPGVTGNTFNPATAGPGMHTITYSGVAGCNNSSATTTITVNPLPVVNAGTYAPVCANAAAVTLAGTPAGGTFSGPGITGTTFNPAVAGPGTHTITYNYTDANGCSNTNTATITVVALPIPIAGTYGPVCIDAAPVTLNGAPAGGTFSGPGVTGNTFNPATAGAGSHTITYNYTNANGCAASTSTTIVVNALPAPLAGTYGPICAEAAAITLAGTPAGGTFSGPGVTGTTFNPSVAGPGMHTIVYSYTANTGCSQTNSTTITVHPRPTSTFTVSDNSICTNETSTLQSTGTVATGNIATWTWNLGDGNPPQSYPNANPLTIGYPTHNTYTVSLVTVSDRGCTSTTTTQTIGVHPLPNAGFVLPAGICMPQGNAVFNNSTTVPDNSGLTYVWNFGDPASGANNTSTATNPSHTYAVVNNYSVTLTATSAFGCVDQDVQVLNNFFDKPVALFNVTPAELCQGAANTFTNNSSDPNGSALTYSWNFGDNSPLSASPNPVKTYTLPGDYTITLTVTNAIGCKSDPYPQPVKVHLQPVVDAGNSFVVPQGTSVQFTATANSPSLTFTWTPPLGLNDPNVLKPTLIAIADQTYTLTATNEFGCSDDDFITVKILKPVTVPNIFTPNGDGIHDTWLIPNLADYPGCTVEVFNRYGQKVFHSAGYGTPWNGTFKGKDMPVGTYYYVIQLQNGFKPMTGSITIVR